MATYHLIAPPEGTASVSVSPTDVFSDLLELVEALREHGVTRVSVVRGCDDARELAKRIDRALYDLGFDVV